MGRSFCPFLTIEGRAVPECRSAIFGWSRAAKHVRIGVAVGSVCARTRRSPGTGACWRHFTPLDEIFGAILSTRTSFLRNEKK